MQHNLEQLGPSGFQDLAAALAVAEFGSHVQVLGSGRDGGRDMFCNGVLIWSRHPEDEQGDVWDGYTVFQAKHKERLFAEPQRNTAWLWAQIKSELSKWADPDSGRDPVPNYLLFITNVPLSPVPDTGGLATINKNIQSFIDSFADESRDDSGLARQLRLEKKARLSRLRAWRLWDANQIDTLLEVHAGVRRAFGAFLTVPDVFAHLGDFTDKLPIAELEPGLRRHARTALMGERFIYFDEAGSGMGTGTPIEQVAIDLPVTPCPDGSRRTVFGHVLDRGEHVLKPRLGLHNGPRHIVLAGAPGSGKTTVSKFLVQTYRSALLCGEPDLGADHLSVIEGTERTLKRLGPGMPKHRRWPMRIDLAEYVEEGGLVEDTTLMRWIATKVSKRSNMGDVTPNALLSWMKQWPWFVILDGLDEVTEPTTRKRLIARITEFVSDAEGDDCDLLVVVTTRPTGYVENIAPSQFERIDLSRLEVDEAVQYGIRTTRIRLRGDADKVDVNAPNRLGRICPVGSFLALDLLDDGMARSHPRFYDRLLVQGLKVLRMPDLADPLAVARVFVRAAQVGDRTRTMIAEAFREALGGDPVSRQTAEQIQSLLTAASQEADIGPEAMMLTKLRAKASLGTQPSRTSDPWEEFEAALTGLGDSEASQAKAAAAGASVQRVRDSRNIDVEIGTIFAALVDSESARILELALEQVAADEPWLVAALRDSVVAIIQRRALGGVMRG